MFSYLFWFALAQFRGLIIVVIFDFPLDMINMLIKELKNFSLIWRVTETKKSNCTKFICFYLFMDRLELLGRCSWHFIIFYTEVVQLALGTGAMEALWNRAAAWWPNCTEFCNAWFLGLQISSSFLSLLL